MVQPCCKKRNLVTKANRLICSLANTFQQNTFQQNRFQQQFKKQIINLFLKIKKPVLFEERF
jgi:thioredoxin-related protein